MVFGLMQVILSLTAIIVSVCLCGVGEVNFLPILGYCFNS